MSGTEEPPPKLERLDVEDEDQRQARIGSLLASKNVTKANDLSTKSTNIIVDERPEIYAVGPSDVLARARAFLPLMADANRDVLQKAQENPDQVNLESTVDDERVIEMDVGLGVFDVNGDLPSDAGPGHPVSTEIPRGLNEEEDQGEDEDEEDEDEEDDDYTSSSESDTSSETSSSALEDGDEGANVSLVTEAKSTKHR